MKIYRFSTLVKHYKGTLLHISGKNPDPAFKITPILKCAEEHFAETLLSPPPRLPLLESPLGTLEKWYIHKAILGLADGGKNLHELGAFLEGLTVRMKLAVAWGEMNKGNIGWENWQASPLAHYPQPQCALAILMAFGRWSDVKWLSTKWLSNRGEVSIGEGKLKRRKLVLLDENRLHEYDDTPDPNIKAIVCQTQSALGIDAICRDPKGIIVVVEVKAHRNTGDPRINPEATPEKFAKERLSQAETGKLWGRDVDDVTRKAAERFLRDIKNKMPLRGLIVDIQHVLGVKTKTRWFEWKKGVGNETSNP